MWVFSNWTRSNNLLLEGLTDGIRHRAGSVFGGGIRERGKEIRQRRNGVGGGIVRNGFRPQQAGMGAKLVGGLRRAESEEGRLMSAFRQMPDEFKDGDPAAVGGRPWNFRGDE